MILENQVSLKVSKFQKQIFLFSFEPKVSYRGLDVIYNWAETGLLPVPLKSVGHGSMESFGDFLSKPVTKE